MITLQGLQAKKRAGRNKKRKAIRLAALILVCILTFALNIAYGSEVSGFGTGGETEITVSAGDTLWALAAAHRPKKSDIRDYMAEIMRANNLDSPVIYPGQVLHLPR